MSSTWNQTRSVGRLALLGLALAACSDTSDDASAGRVPDAAYLFAAIVSSGDDANTYVNLLTSVEGQTVDNRRGREFSGSSDVWVFDNAAFIADQESQTITKFKLVDGALEERAKLGFSDYGLTDFGFWVNTFVDAHKAYLLNAPSEYIVWDPSEMTITGTFPMPELEAQGKYGPQAGYVDRAGVVRDGLLYHPIYFADDSYFEYAPNSRILVVDTARDEVVDVLEAPCPGLDFATQLENGDLYFSTWVFAPAGAAVMDSPKTCVVKVTKDAPREVELAFQVSDWTEGREGGAFRYIGDGRAVLSVLHDDRAAEEGVSDVQGVSFGAYWRFWLVDLEQESAEPFDAIDWNGGAAYTSSAHGREYMLVPSGDYSRTSVYDLTAPDLPRVLDTQGWALRLFGLD